MSLPTDPLAAPLPRSLVRPRQEERRICQNLTDVRCRCGKLLFRANLSPGTEVEAWCDRCKGPVFIFIPPSVIVES